MSMGLIIPKTNEEPTRGQPDNSDGPGIRPLGLQRFSLR
jgi:hypothetical protein